MKKLLLAVCMCAVPFSAMAEVTLEGDPEDVRALLYSGGNVVRIFGESEKTAYADKAIASLLLTTEEYLLSRAIAANGNLRERVAAVLIASGVAPDAIQSSKFSTSPQYGWLGSKPASYIVVNHMAISLVRERYLREIATVADTHEGVALSDLSFEHTQKDAFNHQVRIEALNDVMKQKAFYERTLGVTLTPVRIVDGETRLNSTPGAQMRLAASMTEGEVASRAERDGSRMPALRSPNESGSASFNEIHYEAAFSVDFRIEESSRVPPCASDC